MLYGPTERYDFIRQNRLSARRERTRRSPIVTFDEQTPCDELKELVRKTIEDTIDAMLGKRANELASAERKKRSD